MQRRLPPCRPRAARAATYPGPGHARATTPALSSPASRQPPALLSSNAQPTGSPPCLPTCSTSRSPPAPGPGPPSLALSRQAPARRRLEPTRCRPSPRNALPARGMRAHIHTYAHTHTHTYMHGSSWGAAAPSPSRDAWIWIRATSVCTRLMLPTLAPPCPLLRSPFLLPPPLVPADAPAFIIHTRRPPCPLPAAPSWPRVP